MAITWDIKEIKTNPTGGVTYVHYCAWDEEVVGEGLESKAFSGYYDAFVEYMPDSGSDEYTDFDSLTKDQVLGWVKSTIGSEIVETIENAVTAQVETAKQNATPVSFPWETAD